VATALAVYWMALAILPPVGAWLAGALFAVHPVHVEAVANVVGRAELMAAAGYAFALVCAARADANRRYLAGVALGAAFAIASKEIAVTLPAAVFLIYLAQQKDLRLARRPAIAATVPILLYFVLHGLVGIRTFYGGGLAVGLEQVGMVPRTWAMVRLSLEWWRLFLFPAHLSADYSPGELMVSTGFTIWHLVGLAVWAGLGLLAWRTRRTIPGIAIGLAWVVITISPVANVVMPTEFLIAERTLYLASFGVVLALASLAMTIRSPQLRKAVVTIAVVAGAARSIARVPAWHDDETHYQALRREAPLSYRTLWLEGKDEFVAGRWGSGERLLLQSIAFAPRLTGPRVDLAKFYMQAKLWQPAVAQLRTAVALDSTLTLAREALQVALDSAGVGRRSQ